MDGVSERGWGSGMRVDDAGSSRPSAPLARESVIMFVRSSHLFCCCMGFGVAQTRKFSGGVWAG